MSGFSGPRFGAPGGSAGSNPGVAYVQSDGVNANAELGNPAKPFLTVAAAITAAEAASQTHITLVFGRGTFVAGAILTSTVTSIFLTGAGVGATVLNATWVGAVGSTGVSGEPEVTTDGGAGESFDGGPVLRSDQSLTLNISITAGNGGPGGDNTGETGTGGGGGAGGNVDAMTLQGVVGSVAMVAGSGGSEGSGPEGAGTPGNAGVVSASSFRFCDLTITGSTDYSGPTLSIINGVAQLEV